MNIEISRRAFLAAGPLAVIGSLGLAGCGKSSISGKTLYYYSVCGSVALGKVCANKPGSASTIKFDDDTWHYVGSTELSGDWKAEGDDVVLSSSQLGTVTLVRQDDGSYVPSGSEGYGERYFVDESAAQSYYNEYTAATPDRVRDTLESATWSVKNPPSAQTVAETLSFDDGSLAFTKGEYQRGGLLHRCPARELMARLGPFWRVRAQRDLPVGELGRIVAATLNLRGDDDRRGRDDRL